MRFILLPFNLSISEVIRKMVEIPANVTTLDVVLNDFGKMRAAELAPIFSAIPANITSLTFGGNHLDEMREAELASIFSAIPAHITSLNLSWNHLGKMNGADFAALFSAIPANITSLNLGINHLGQLTAIELAALFSALSASITSIDLESNLLSEKTGAELVRILSALRENITSINLGMNDLGKKTGAEIVAIVKALPQKLRSLNLNGNELGLRTAEELVTVLGALPTSITSLNLWRNNLAKKGLELATILKELPRYINAIDFSGNLLGYKPKEELMTIFAGVPANIESIALQWNNLGNKPFAELVTIFSALPANVTSLNLSGNNLVNIHNALPFNVETIILDAKIIYRDSFVVNQLISQVSNLNKKRNLAFDTISLPVEIDEACLNRIIPVFEQQNTAIASLICGLLLEGQIKTTTEEKYSQSEHKKYMEKRTQDAISFYTKAATDSITRAMAEFLLWEMKQTCNLPSVQKRLAEYDLYPIYASQSFNQTDKKQKNVTLHFLTELGLFKSPSSSDEEFVVASKNSGAKPFC